MPCQLKADPNHNVDFVAAIGVRVTIFLDSPAAHLVSAGNNLLTFQLTDGKAVFTTVAGFNIIRLVVAGPDQNEVCPVKEDCGGGASQQLTTVTVANAAVEIAIHAS
jgi:hypothetical protein